MGRWAPGVALGLCLMALCCVGCARNRGGAPSARSAAQRLVPVKVAIAQKQTVPITLEAVGTVQPFATVGVRSQVTGILQKVDFRQGQEVQKGQLLFELDPGPFEAALDQAQGNLIRDRAKYKDARALVRRYRPLVKRGFVTRQAYEDAIANAQSAEATVSADEAAVKAAKINLGYTTIRAPVSGRTGALQVDVGNVVQALGSTPLVTIDEIQPIRVQFAVPGSDLPALRNLGPGAHPVEATPGQSTGQSPVASLEGGFSAAPSHGVLSFIDNGIDTTTGTLMLKADFPNRDELLWPGEFVNVTLTLGRTTAVVVPASAVQVSQNGTFVFVVGANRTVSSRKVSIARSDEHTAVLASGVKAGETVVTDGQLRLSPGAKVSIQSGNQSGP